MELIESEPHESGPALRTGEVDVIVTTTDYVEFPWDRDLEIIPLGADPVVLVLPPDHPLARRRVVDLAACADETWACDRPGSYMAELTRRLCHESGFEPRVACRFGNYLLLLQHVESGGSVALLPALAVARDHAVVTRELTTPVHRNVASSCAAERLGGRGGRRRRGPARPPRDPGPRTGTRATAGSPRPFDVAARRQSVAAASSLRRCSSAASPGACASAADATRPSESRRISSAAARRSPSPACSPASSSGSGTARPAT